MKRKRQVTTITSENDHEYQKTTTYRKREVENNLRTNNNDLI